MVVEKDFYSGVAIAKTWNPLLIIEKKKFRNHPALTIMSAWSILSSQTHRIFLFPKKISSYRENLLFF